MLARDFFLGALPFDDLIFKYFVRFLQCLTSLGDFLKESCFLYCNGDMFANRVQ
jgi:hypothetical protein